MTPWGEAGARLLLASLLGAALFTLISAVGFFGSGADPALQGLTTAASLWTVAAIGTAGAS